MFWWSAYYMFWYVNGLKLSQEHFELHGSREREGACFTWRGLIQPFPIFWIFYWKQQNEISQRNDNRWQKVLLQILFDCCKDSWCLPYWNGVNPERAPNNSIAPQLAFVRYKLYGFLAVVYQLLCAIAMYFVMRRCNGESFRAFPPF